MKKNITKDQKGFTIVEVLIVLAIAGLIILIVLLAVPALQRNSRNTQRKNDVSQLSGAISERINNNSGQLDQDSVAAVTGTTTPGAPGISQVVINAVGGMSQLAQMDYEIVAAGTDANVNSPLASDGVMIRNNLKCNPNYQDPGTNTDDLTVTIGTGAGDIVTTTSATFRSIVAVYAVERSGGFTGQCQEL